MRNRRAWSLLGLVLGLVVLLPQSVWGAQPAGSPSAPLTIVNGNAAGPILALDSLGNAIDAHDGSMLYAGGVYHLYGTSYGCGYVRLLPHSPFCGFVSYHSRDLQHWHPDGPLFNATTARWQQSCNGSTLSCYRPHVVYNARTHRYVLWINSYDGGPGHRLGTFHVFTSASAAGPFAEVARPHVVDSFAGDLDLFVDTNGRGYLAYTGWQQGADIVVEELTTSFTATTGRWSRIGSRRVEAPSLFKHAGMYYLTVSQPACAYCAGTGTAYFTATSPLGPWNGPTNSTVQVVNGSLWLRGASAFGPTMTDGVVRATFTPLPSGHTLRGPYAAASLYFRAVDANTGYRWILGTRPVPGAPHGGLTTEVRVKGRVISTRTVALSLRVGAAHTLEITAKGASITTRVDGRIVDARTDTTRRSGRVGMLVAGTETVHVSDVIVTAGTHRTQYFRHSLVNDLATWTISANHQQGRLISATSCGGQPADVVMLPASGAGTPVPLLMIDRWNNAAPNQALASQLWEPLSFRGTALQPLRCRATYRVPAQGSSDANVVDQLLDVSTGWRGFRALDGISGTEQIGQTFRVGRSGLLYRVGINVMRNWRTARSYLQIRNVVGAGRLGSVLFQTAISPHWSPDLVVVAPTISVVAGQELAVVLRSPGGGVGTVGVLYHDLNPYRGGSAIRSSDNGRSFTRLPGDLRVVTDVKPA